MTPPQDSPAWGVPLLAIDPGYAKKGKGCACAAFDETGALEEVWFERPGRLMHDGPNFRVTHREQWRRAQEGGRAPLEAGGRGFGIVLVERPEFHGDRTLGAGESPMVLSWEGAMLAGMFAGRDGWLIAELTPSEWKGSEAKPVQHARLWSSLSEAERGLLGGVATESAIYAARTKGALNRWAKSGGDYYPGSFLTHNLLDAVALGKFYLGLFQTGARKSS